MNPELVLVVGDMFLPQRSPDINEQFKSILTPNKVQHVLCLGNIGNQETLDWLKGLSKDFHIVKGDFDTIEETPERKVIQVGDFNIGLIHGHQILPWGDLDSLGIMQRNLGCDILISGHTHKISINVKDNALFLNPGSFTGAFSPLIEDSIPSFILMVLTGDEAIIYLYTLNDKNKKFDVAKYDYKKGADEVIHNEGEEDDNNDEDINDNKDEDDDINKENEPEPEQEAEPKEDNENNNDINNNKDEENAE